MSESTVAPVPGPETELPGLESQNTSSPETQLDNPAHETPEPLPVAEPNSLAERVKRAVGKVFEFNGVRYQKNPKGGKRRYDSNGNPVPIKGDIPLDDAQSAIPATGVPEPSKPATVDLDPALVRDCISAVWKSIASWGERKLFRTAKEAGYTPEKAHELEADCRITQTELESLTKLTECALRKYGVGAQMAPETGLLVVLGGISVRYTLAVQALQKGKEE
jgi:hypothetical protein